MAVYNTQGGQNTHFDRILTNVSVAFPNEGMVGERLFPVVRVNKQSDKYYIFGREAWGLDPGGDLRAPGTVANEIPGLQLSVDSYYAQEHALQIAITDEERENVDPPAQADRDGTELVTSKVLLGREVAMKALVTTTANYATGYSTTLAGNDQWSDYANSDPIGDIKTGRRKVHSGLFLEPNVGIFPYEVMAQLEDHPDFIERIKYSERGILTPDIIGAVVGIPNLIIPGMGYNSANPGIAMSLGYLWGKDVVLAYVPPRAGLKIPAFGYEYVMTYGGRVQQVDRWREEARGSDVVRVKRRYDLKLTALDGSGKSIAGYVIKAAVA